MSRTILILLVSAVSVFACGESEENPCLLGGDVAAEAWRDGQKIELLATATMGKNFGFQGFKCCYPVDKVEIELSIWNYPNPKEKDREECVHRILIYVDNPAVGEAEPEAIPKDGRLTYRVAYTWGNADQNKWMDYFGGHLSGESQLTITEYADGYISGTFRFEFDNAMLEDGRFTHVPIAR